MRRRFIAGTVLSCLFPLWVGKARARAGEVWRAFMARAFEMRRQAEAAGDPPYGALVVKDWVIIAESPSRVASAANIDAHAEREALRLAQQRLGTQDLSGCVLVSSSQPCPLCERAAYRAHVARMIHGERLTDGGPLRA